MRICLFEDQQVDFLEPLALTRAAFHLRCGAYSLMQRHHIYFAATEVGAIVRPHLADLCRWMHPDMAVNDSAWLGGVATVMVNGRWLPPEGQYEDPVTPRVALVGEQVAYVVPPKDTQSESAPESVADSLEHWKQALPHVQAGGWMIDYPWDLIEHNGDLLCRDFPHGSRPSASRDGLPLVGPRDRLFVDPSATVDPMVVADTTHGPVVIEREAVVHAFTRLEGPCYIGPGSWVLGAKVRGHTTIGPMCRVGGEIEASIIHGYSNKYHDGFLGHSYVGEWVNLAAGTQVSDLRNDYGRVPVTLNGTKLDTGQSKIGSFIGDHSKTGLSVLLNTGTVVGAFCNLLPSGSFLPKAIPSFCRYYRGQVQARSDWREMITTAAKVMQRRGQELTDIHTTLFNVLYDQTAAQRKQALREGEQRRLRQIL
jgi:UDP-N-acetylglucosamine diphosphorylase / glucose-1-phosphate thymidylyltransferase / UDP-N-acetylgalactosamine diphosphorylase / glucosamine-1-phosphate N-acetyltransferase / galactosamine-1-phosphate N-acetyltransferase